MIWAEAAIIGACAFTALGSILYRGDNIIAVPTIIGATALGFLLPQYVWMIINRYDDPNLTLFTALTTLSMCAVTLGWLFGSAGSRYHAGGETINGKQVDCIFAIAVLYFGVGMFGRVKLSSLDPELVSAGIWSGEPVFYGFFFNFVFYAFALAWPLYILTKRTKLLIIALLAGLVFAEYTILAGRREKTALFVCMVISPVILTGRLRIPRLVGIAFLAGGVLFVPLIGVYRDAVRAHSFFVPDERPSLTEIFERLGQVDWVAAVGVDWSFQQMEIANALAILKGIKTLDDFAFGLGWYNCLVHHFVPGQIVGLDIKMSLMSSNGDPRNVMEGHTPWPGSTYTGVADGFFNIGYAVPLAFGVIGYLSGTLFRRAKEGSVIAMIIYPLLAVKTGNAFSHTIGNYIVEIVYVTMFLIGPLLVAKRLGTAGVKRGIRLCVRNTDQKPKECLAETFECGTMGNRQCRMCMRGTCLGASDLTIWHGRRMPLNSYRLLQ